MAVTMWYRGIRFTKDFIVKYLNYIFMANSKGSLLFTDGTKKIEFARVPVVTKRGSWDPRSLPTVIVGKATGGLKYITFSKDLLQTTTDVASATGMTNLYSTVGGDFDLNINLSVRSTTMEERDNLVDIVGIYLSHPNTKDYFMNHYLVLPEAPRLVGESDIMEPGIEYPIYATDLSFRVITRWQEYTEDELYTLGKVIVDIEAEFDLTT